MRYYSTQRPVMPGSYPKPQGNTVKEVHNFDERTYCEEIGREAWGYIEYERPLHRDTAADYELTAASGKRGDEYKVKQLRQMLAHETSRDEEHYGARLSHWYGDTNTLTIDAGGLKALIRYYEEHGTDLENHEEDK